MKSRIVSILVRLTLWNSTIWPRMELAPVMVWQCVDQSVSINPWKCMNSLTDQSKVMLRKSHPSLNVTMRDMSPASCKHFSSSNSSKSLFRNLATIYSPYKYKWYTNIDVTWKRVSCCLSVTYLWYFMINGICLLTCRLTKKYSLSIRNRNFLSELSQEGFKSLSIERA